MLISLAETALLAMNRSLTTMRSYMLLQVSFEKDCAAFLAAFHRCEWTVFENVALEVVDGL